LEEKGARVGLEIIFLGCLPKHLGMGVHLWWGEENQCVSHKPLSMLTTSLCQTYRAVGSGLTFNAFAIFFCPVFQREATQPGAVFNQALSGRLMEGGFHFKRRELWK